MNSNFTDQKTFLTANVFRRIKILLLIPSLFFWNASIGASSEKKILKQAAAFQTVSIAFVPSGTAPATGYTADNGLAYSSARGYGWISPTTGAAQAMTANTRIRTGSSDKRLLGVMQMQATDKGQVPGTWQYAVPNGQYRVTIGAGDEQYFDSDHQINAEGLPVISDLVTTTAAKHKISIAVVQVTDGLLTIDATGGVNSKINFIIIAPVSTVTDTSAPTASVRFTGTTVSTGVYSSAVQIIATATDVGNSGLSTFQYSINNAAFVAYKAPVSVVTAGSYSVVIKATDANNNTFTSVAKTFVIQGATTTPVTPGQSTGTYMVLNNTNGFPSNDHLVFSYLQEPWRRTSPDTTPYNANHNIVKLAVSNLGVNSLVISKLTMSRPGAWKVIAINSDSSATLPVTIKSQGVTNIAIRFMTTNAASRVKIFHDTMTIASNDSIAPVKKVMLDGLWQLHGEGLTEPWAQEILNLYNFKTNTGYNHDDNGLKGSAIVPNSSEVAEDYFVQSDVSKPVTVTEIGQYHGCCNAITPLRYYLKGSSTASYLFTTNNLDGQSVLPREIGSTTRTSQATFNASGPFGFLSDNTMYSDRTKNYEGKIGIKFWKVLDANGNIVPNAMLAGVDYLGTQFSNSDYQDDVYYIDNIKPAAGSVFYSNLVATPEDVNFTPALVGGTSTFSINLLNSGMKYANGTSDPAITIKSITITGPNASEFAVGTLAASTLAIQTGTTLGVKFLPKTLGIKNAALLINYGNTTPLRIPLYGIANTVLQTISAVKRYKGGSDADLRISNLVWSSDKSIRSGSVKLDMQIIKSSVACTVADSLYQTYLSAATNLASTSYNIPLANGTYMVRMHFVENYYNMENGRVFNITMENQAVLKDFDIFKEVGYRSALVKDFTVNVTDGSLSIKFSPTANRVALGGLEIYKAVAGTANALAAANSLVADTAAAPKSTALNKVFVYPDPGDGTSINLKAENFKPLEKVTYVISDIFGKQLSKGSFFINIDGTAQVPVTPSSRLGKGVYIVNSSSPSGVFHSKFIVQ